MRLNWNRQGEFM